MTPVSIVVDGDATTLERWQRVGVRIRAADGDNVVRRMRRGGIGPGASD